MSQETAGPSGASPIGGAPQRPEAGAQGRGFQPQLPRCPWEGPLSSLDLSVLIYEMEQQHPPQSVAVRSDAGAQDHAEPTGGALKMISK